MSEDLKEQLVKVAAWVLLAAWILFYSYRSHEHGQSDAIPSQAWSFGEPGE